MPGIIVPLAMFNFFKRKKKFFLLKELKYWADLKRYMLYGVDALTCSICQIFSHKNLPQEKIWHLLIPGFLFKVNLQSRRTSMFMWQETEQLGNLLAPSVKSSPTTRWAMCATTLRANIFQILSRTHAESVPQCLEPSMPSTCIKEHTENMSRLMFSE